MESKHEPHVAISIEDSEERGSIARIVVDNQARLNILNTGLIMQLTSAVEAVAGRRNLRLVILTGAGERAFIGGADINEMARLDSASARGFITGLHQACEALRNLPVPVIARICGYCLGAGVEIAISCDLRVAAAHSTFGMPEVKVGIPSVIEAALLPRLIGYGKARELVYTGSFITADEALGCGLVERVVPLGHLDRAVGEWTESILQGGPQAIRLQKALIRDWESLPLNQAIDRGVEAFSRSYLTDEPRRFMNRFLRSK